MNERAIDVYHSLLSGPLAKQTVEALTSGIERHRLSFGNRPICSVLRPYFISSTQYNHVRDGSALVLSAIYRLGKALLEDDDLRANLDLTPAEEEIISIDSGYDAPDASGRLDAFLGTDGEFRFVEYNSDSPGGLLFGDVLSEIFTQMEIVREFSKVYQVRRIPVRPLIFDALIKSFSQWNRGPSNRLPQIAIVDWKEVPTRNEFEICREYFESQGCPTIIVDPEKLEYSSGNLRAGEFQIDLVYKRVVTGEFLERCGSNHPLRVAVKEGAVCIVNSFRVELLSKKILFALLDDPEYSNLFTDLELSALRRHIPWTRRLREGYTTRLGRKIDLIDFVQLHREQLVIKPNGAYGGRGVILGWECSDQQWQRSIANALGAPFIVQERVEIPSEVFPTLRNGVIELEERFFDLAPYTWNGEQVAGAGVRLSSSQLLNVTSGAGSAVPMLVIEE